MINVFKYEIKANIKSLLFWSLGMSLMAGIGFVEYSAIVKSSADMSSIIDIMPRIIKVMMGMGSLSIDTLEGYYACMFFWLLLIAFVHAALLGASIVSKEERDKTAEFIFTKPIKRSTVITGKLLASFINILVVNIVAWVTTLVFLNSYIKGTDFVSTINLTMVGMFIVQMIFLLLGFLISSIFKENGKALIYVSMMIIGFYFLSVIVEMVEINYLNFISPFRYFTVIDILDNGLSYLYIIISIIIILISGYFGYVFWNKRDLRS